MATVPGAPRRARRSVGGDGRRPAVDRPAGRTLRRGPRRRHPRRAVAARLPEDAQRSAPRVAQPSQEERSDDMTTRLTSVVIDAAHPGALAHWWSEAIGWPITFIAPDEVVVEPAGNGQSYDVPALVFVPVDDPKTTKNRVHLDLASDSTDHQAELVARLVAAGAAHADVGQSDVPWVVLADPEGNEFCVLEPRDRHIGRGPIASIVVDAADPADDRPLLGRRQRLADRRRARRGGQPAQPPRPAPRPRFRAGRRRQGRSKNRVHLDVAPYEGEDQIAEVARLVALGADTHRRRPGPRRLLGRPRRPRGQRVLRPHVRAASHRNKIARDKCSESS